MVKIIFAGLLIAAPQAIAQQTLDFSRCLGASGTPFGFTDGVMTGLASGAPVYFDRTGRLIINRRHPDLVRASSERVVLRTRTQMMATNTMEPTQRRIAIAYDGEERPASIQYDLWDPKALESLTTFQRARNLPIVPQVTEETVTFRYRGSACEVDQITGKFVPNPAHPEQSINLVSYDRTVCDNVRAIERDIPQSEKNACVNYLGRLQLALQAREIDLLRTGRTLGLTENATPMSSPLGRLGAVSAMCQLGARSVMGPTMPSVADPAPQTEAPRSDSPTASTSAE